MATIEPSELESDLTAGRANGSFLTDVHRVFDAGERLLLDQAELVRLDWRIKLSGVATRFGLALAGFVLLLLAWLGLVVAAITALDGVPLAWRIGGAAVVQLLIGLALLLAARLAARRTPRGENDAT